MKFSLLPVFFTMLALYTNISKGKKIKVQLNLNICRVNLCFSLSVLLFADKEDAWMARGKFGVRAFVPLDKQALVNKVSSLALEAISDQGSYL